MKRQIGGIAILIAGLGFAIYMSSVKCKAGACFPLAVSSLNASTPSFAEKHRIIFEVTMDGQQQWTGTLNNVASVQQAFGADTTDVEVVAHGNGLGFLLKTDEALQAPMQLASSGVTFSACENTMKKKNVSKEELLPFVTTVDSGVAEVVRKQEAGWAYLKSGD
jgi:uncharacterized protein